jgi:hypothetical protein
MSTRKRISRKKLQGKDRTNNATRWLQSQRLPKNMVAAYAKRYGVTELVARDELISIGYYDEILIQKYEEEGIEWKFMVEPRTGEMYVVPEDAEEHEFYEYHPFF